MMVVHEDNETPVEVAVIRQPLLEQKSYVIVKNHVRELINNDQSISSMIESNEQSQKSETVGKKKRKPAKKPKKNAQIPTTSEKREGKTNITTEIDKNDLQELRTVYMKCKEVMRNIEAKYGHLLDLDCEAGPSSCRKRKINIGESSDYECDCKLNTKIVFDDEGKQSNVEQVSEKHICAKKVKASHSEMITRSRRVAIEYTDNEINLPDNLQELSSLVQDPDIEKTLRNKIVNKMRMLKQEYVNEIRFNKHAIIEKLKANPDEVLGFKGTNLSTIPGYS